MKGNKVQTRTVYIKNYILSRLFCVPHQQCGSYRQRNKTELRFNIFFFIKNKNAK